MPIKYMMDMKVMKIGQISSFCLEYSITEWVGIWCDRDCWCGPILRLTALIQYDSKQVLLLEFWLVSEIT